jgi:hypothetical protein
LGVALAGRISLALNFILALLAHFGGASGWFGWDMGVGVMTFLEAP